MFRYLCTRQTDCMCFPTTIVCHSDNRVADRGHSVFADASPPCAPQPYATPSPPPITIRHPALIFNGGSSDRQMSPLTPDAEPTLSFLPPLPTLTRTSGSGSSSVTTCQNGGGWVWKGEEGSLLMRSSSGLGEGVEDEWGSVLKLPASRYRESVHSSPHMRPDWSGWGGSGKRDRDGRGIGEGPPHSLCLVFHGSGTEGWTLRSSRDSPKQRRDMNLDLDLDLSLGMSPPGQGGWSGQVVSGLGEAQEAGGVGVCLDLRLDLPQPGGWGAGI